MVVKKKKVKADGRKGRKKGVVFFPLKPLERQR